MIVSVLDLWLPIVLAAVAIFIYSFLANVVSPHHKGDWKELPNEDGMLEAVRGADIPAGQYMFPYCHMKDFKDPAVKARYEKGPHGILIRWPGAANMPKNLVLTFIYYLVVGACVAYAATLAFNGRPAEPAFMDAFRCTGAVAMFAYCLGCIPGTIWFGYSWRSTWMYIIDGLISGAVTGVFFAWLWPVAESAMPAMPVVGG
jgi:hypothetical protein